MTAGISGYGEFEQQVKAGKLRVLAVSSPERLPNVDAPTLKESGTDVEVLNWRGVWGGPDLTPEQKAELIGKLEKVNASKSWTDTLAAKGWSNTFLTGDAFADVLKQEIEKTTAVLKEIGLVK